MEEYLEEKNPEFDNLSWDQKLRYHKNKFKSKIVRNDNRMNISHD